MIDKILPTRLLWVDLEMTGLDPANQRIIEVAALVTNFELKEIARYESVVRQPVSVLENAEEWPKQNMAELFEKVKVAEKDEPTIIDELVSFIELNFPNEKAILAGNSISQDRLFIKQWWKPVDDLLHYRMFDVSSFKVWIQGVSGEEYVKKKQHRALSDIEESIDELKWSLDKLTANNCKD